ncbi:MAG: cytochrome P460 family protein [Nitrospirota bacterium]|nr:cytochrome P460 family protein [Nitrospirota bacterium]
MKLFTVISIGFVLILSSWVGWAMTNDDRPFAQIVNPETGAISVPGNYREWPTLGTWAHAKVEGGPGLQEYHIVYTQPETITYYQKKGKFPDGAILVKELLNAETMAMTTGPAVGHGTTVKGWFVLVRDTKGRFKASSLWGDGWGWSLFNSDDPNHTVSKDYKTDCIPCHMPARDLARKNAVDEDKWIYTFGYPVLQKK